MKNRKASQEKAAIQQGCSDKTKHPSKGKAEASARGLERRFNIKYTVYPCANCEGWHTRSVKTD